MMTPDTWGARSSANTAPASRSETAPVVPEQSYYQTQLPQMQGYTPPPAFVAPARRSPVGWILAFIGIGVFAAIIFAVMFVARQARRAINDLPRGPASAVAPQPGEVVLSESGADRVENSPGAMILTKTVSLGGAAKIQVRNITGSVTIGVWDEPRAQVKVTKKGSEADRKLAQVFLSNDGGNLSLRSGPRRNSEVDYDITLPREVGELFVSTVNGNIRVSDLSGRIKFENTNGSTDLLNVSGLSSGKSVNGNVTVVLSDWSDDGLELVNVNGNISLQVKSDLDADFDATTVGGNISIDDSFGVAVERKMVGEKASGKIGEGGPRLSLKTVSGNISLKK